MKKPLGKGANIFLSVGLGDPSLFHKIIFRSLSDVFRFNFGCLFCKICDIGLTAVDSAYDRLFIPSLLKDFSGCIKTF